MKEVNYFQVVLVEEDCVLKWNIEQTGEKSVCALKMCASIIYLSIGLCQYSK